MFISNGLSPIWLLRSSGLHGKVGMDSASNRCRRNGNIVTYIYSTFQEFSLIIEHDNIFVQII